MEKTSPPKLFSEKRRLAVEARANSIGKSDANFLSKIAAETLAERIEVINREFQKPVDFLSSHSAMHAALNQVKNVSDIKQVTSEACCPEKVPLEAKSADLITSVFALHRSNDLPGSLIQIRNALINDGLFMAALPGENTLKELRECLLTAEAEIYGRASLRVEPFGEIRQIGSLLQRAGFALPVVDSETFTIRYKNFQSLIKELRAMGATSTLAEPSAFSNRKFFDRAEAIYNDKYCQEDGKIIATAEIIFLSGWVPDISQQKPLKPGTAKNQLKDFL